MKIEFTGERVIPGEVDIDLWNEHLSRYAFASRLARRKRVLDIGCGAGYGSGELALTASAVTGIDVSTEALSYAAGHYDRPNLTFQLASATALPFPDESFDFITAFEVIEHLREWDDLLAEASRVLTSGGQFVVSTPNISYYSQSRQLSGPNPFHEHEFTYDEFRQALEKHFPHVLCFTENHSPAIVFRPVDFAAPLAADVRMESSAAPIDEAHFFVAVCAKQRMTGSPAFLYVPSSGNVLQERERHIARLESEVATKSEWLSIAQANHAALVTLHDEQTVQLKKANQWALSLDEQLKEAGQRIVELQKELEDEQSAARATAQAYESEIRRVEDEKGEAIRWGQALERDLTAELVDARLKLQECLDLLHKAEALVEERTLWAQSVSAELEQRRGELNRVRASRWLKLGRKFGLGPDV